MNISKELLSDKNVNAFLMMIRHCEGTDQSHGYEMLFGGKLFESFKDHPHIYSTYKNKNGEVIKTSAAGAYQIIYKTWEVLNTGLL